MGLHEIRQEGRGICGFVSMIQLLLDTRELTYAEFERKYKNKASRFAQEWIDTQIAHDRLEGNKDALIKDTALKQCLSFTHEFGEEYNYTVKDLEEGKWEGLALIPEAICDYILRKYNN